MYHTINEFLHDWKSESDATMKVLQSITDESLSFTAQNYRRTIGRLAWHITGAIGEMMRSSGSEIDVAEDTMKQPDTAVEILSEYKKASVNFISKLMNDWSDESLKDEVNMYGEMWSRAFILRVLINHQIHHRAQLTVLMRIAGLEVPGIYGPSYEEWKQFGVEPQV